MGTPITGFWCPLLLAELREAIADFATNLSSELAIIKIEKLGWSTTVRTRRSIRHFARWIAVMDGLQRIAVSLFKTSQQLLPV